MTLDELLALSPFVYHATRHENIHCVASERCLLSPAAVQQRRGMVASTSPRRSRSKGAPPAQFKVPLGKYTVHLCDHDLLHEGNIAFEEGWDMPRFIGRLNGLVFFWPGSDSGPIAQGHSHWGRYSKSGETFAVLRSRLRDLVAMNSAPLVSACNSGAPRHNPISRRQPRGGNTFMTLGAFPSTSNVVEVVFDNQAVLPDSTEFARSYAGPWLPLAQSE